MRNLFQITHSFIPCLACLGFCRFGWYKYEESKADFSATAVYRLVAEVTFSFEGFKMSKHRPWPIMEPRKRRRPHLYTHKHTHTALPATNAQSAQLSSWPPRLAPPCTVVLDWVPLEATLFVVSSRLGLQLLLFHPSPPLSLLPPFTSLPSLARSHLSLLPSFVRLSCFRVVVPCPCSPSRL